MLPVGFILFLLKESLLHLFQKILIHGQDMKRVISRYNILRAHVPHLALFICVAHQRLLP